MEVDEAFHSATAESGNNNDKLHVYFGGSGNESTSLIHTFDSLSLSTLTLSQFRALVNCTIVPDLTFGVLYNGVLLSGDEKTLASLNVKPNTVVQIVVQKKSSTPTSPSKKIFTEKQVVHLSLALRTAFLSTAFARTVESLSTAETLDTLFAIAPQLRTDPVGISIIQSAHMILQFSEPGQLKHLAATRPWVVEALNFIAATVHGEKKSGSGPLPRGLLASQLLNPVIGDDDEEEMDEGTAGGNAQRTPNNLALITREQLSQALSNAIGAGGVLPFGGQPLRPQPTVPPRPQPIAPIQPPSASSTIPSPAPTTGQLTGELVARAMFEALNQLPPEARAEQLNAFRNLAMQVAAGGGPSDPAASAPNPVPSSSVTASQHSPATTEALSQMRELGISDERLSVLALRVSGGDVATAVELIFSGWQGEGADAMDGDAPME